MNNEPKVLIKKLAPNAKMPVKANESDVGYDLFALEDTEIPEGKVTLVRTGIAIQPPDGFYPDVAPRSSNPKKKNIMFPHSFGVIDPGYRNEVFVQVVPIFGSAHIKAGDAIGQLVFRPIFSFPFTEVVELTDSDRGMGGFGSSGN